MLAQPCTQGRLAVSVRHASAARRLTLVECHENCLGQDRRSEFFRRIFRLEEFQNSQSLETFIESDSDVTARHQRLGALFAACSSTGARRSHAARSLQACPIIRLHPLLVFKLIGDLSVDSGTSFMRRVGRKRGVGSQVA